MTQMLDRLFIGYDSVDYENPDGDYRPMAMVMILRGGVIMAYVDMDYMRSGTPLKWEIGSGWERQHPAVALAIAQRSASEWGLVRLRRSEWLASPMVTGDVTIISHKTA